MNRYDNFNPTIPETEDNVEESVATIEDTEPTVSSATLSSSDKKVKKQNRKSKSPSKTSKTEPSSNHSFLKSFWASVTGQTMRWIAGLVLGFLGIYLLVCFFSYISSCVADQSEVYNTSLGSSKGISNNGGEAGARLSEFLINGSFGVGSAVIILWLLALGMKLLTGYPKFRTLDFTIKCLVALVTVSLIAGQLTIGMHSPVNWGGIHGMFVNEFINNFIGPYGSVLLCCLMVSCFAVVCLRDLINWLIRIREKHAERKKREREEKEEILATEIKLAEMKRMAESESSETVDDNINDYADDAHMSFPEDEAGFYEDLPDFESYSLNLSQIEENESDHSPYIPKDDYGAVNAVDEEYMLPETELNNMTEYSGNPLESEAPSSTPMVVNVNNIAKGDITSEKNTDLFPGCHPYNFPPATLLREGVEKISVDADEQLEKKEKIRKTLLDFGIPIISIEATVGPTVTLYEIVPERGVKINRISNLVNDIALRIAAEGVRIIAPIPGKGAVGIEVANYDPQTVSMRTIIQSKAYMESKCKLPIAIGSTISNEVYIADLASMPHLLVAGATGQGKSVGLNAIIASLLYRKKPDELKFVMVDPKMVEFSLYSKIEKHYLAKIPDAEDAIITDMDKVVATLSSLCVEMDARYQLLKKANTRKIEEYNAKIKEKVLNPLEGHKFMPYIVVIVDEFSDLIMTAGKEVEIPIARLAQKARAVGMHVIIATQRPSTNVITGIIKANFPARIAFKVSSGVDSKTILDTPGAQQLIGRGDMLINNNAPMVRVQCAFIDTPEVEAICDYIERQPYPQGAYLLPEPVVGGSEDSNGELGNNFGDRDPLFEEVARLIVSSNTASTSSLQRRYSIGYNRAGKIMDQLEAAGIVGPSQGGKPRSVLVDTVSLENILGQ